MLRPLWAAFMLTAVLAAPVRGQSAAQGFAPDLQVSGGVGVGLGASLDNNFLGRLRLGALYAFEPYWVNAGLTLELGALAELAIGGELEWNELNGWFAQAGLAYAKHERVTSHVAIGFMIFGLEWQHAFATRKPHDALLFTVRFPLGFWWFRSGRDERPFAPEVPTAPPAAVSGGAGQAPARVQPMAAAAAGAAPAETESARRAREARVEAAFAEARADHASRSRALRRAVAAEPDPNLWLQIADAELARGERALAAEALQQFLALAREPDALARKPAVAARLREVSGGLARLRVAFAAPSGTERVEVDGLERAGAALGYDVLLDPGDHVLRVVRDGRTVFERALVAEPGELVRVDVPELAGENPPHPAEPPQVPPDPSKDGS